MKKNIRIGSMKEYAEFMKIPYTQVQSSLEDRGELDRELRERIYKDHGGKKNEEKNTT